MTSEEAAAARKRRREVAKTLHPDVGGSASAFAQAWSDLTGANQKKSTNVVAFKRRNRAQRLKHSLVKRLRQNRRRKYIDL